MPGAAESTWRSQPRGIVSERGLYPGMWLAVFVLLGELCVRSLVRGGPPLWLALVVGAIVFGGPAHDPIALAAATAVFVGASLLRG